MTELALITGAAGMIGSHLVDLLSGSKTAVLATYFRPTVPLEEILGKTECVELDLRNYDDVRAILDARRPSVVYHLAAQSLPTVSWRDPWETIQSNVLGTVNLFEAIKRVRETDKAYDPRVVVACSSGEYGASLTPDRVPVDEDAPLLPLHPYGVSKVAQDLLAFQYWMNDRIQSIRARIFNTTGPRKRNDVVSDFAARVARVSLQGGALSVGNLETRRALLDVRDLVQALQLLAQMGRAGEVYNICADRAFRIGDLIPMFEAVSGLRLDVVLDQELFRPTDEPIIIGKSNRLMRETGWRQRISIETTIRDTYQYELRRLQANNL